MNNGILRYTAEQRLKGRYDLPIVYILITYAINYAIGYFVPSGVGPTGFIQLTAEQELLRSGLMFVSFLVGVGLSYGYVVFYREVAQGRRPNLKAGLTSGFTTRYGRTLLMSVLIGIYTFFWMLLLIIPGIVAAYSYSMAYYLLVREPNLTASDAITRSKELTNGYKWQIFCLNFSYVGWYLLSILTFGILLLWVEPRHSTAVILLYDDIYKRDYERRHPESITHATDAAPEAV